jgi:hypothetical protein
MSKSSSTSRTSKPTSRRKSAAVTGQTLVNDGETANLPPDDATRRAMIAEAAYYRAERRGFAPGFELEDWLLSENELDASLPTQIQQQSLEKSMSSSAEFH